MKPLTAMIAVGNDIKRFDVIEHEGKHWIVPYWLESPSAGVRKPARLILLDVLERQYTPGGRFGDWVVSHPIPKAVLDGVAPFPPGFVVLEAPDLVLPIPAAH